jgi:hypothetical protein
VTPAKEGALNDRLSVSDRANIFQILILVLSLIIYFINIANIAPYLYHVVSVELLRCEYS